MTNLTPPSASADNEQEEAFLEYAFDGVITATDRYGVNTPELDKAIDEAKLAIALHTKEAVETAEGNAFNAGWIASGASTNGINSARANYLAVPTIHKTDTEVK